MDMLKPLKVVIPNAAVVLTFSSGIPNSLTFGNCSIGVAISLR